ncbi:PLP-dependent aminotransferase family protein [Mucilaginibacter sp. HMF5004]|uniref:aminotransferase-like domain-containing protein n=1 Tax=Mucilaginibacter rivuli TaxID=2857527 RepID=UPI001C604DEC|nr:PLP-dependent aminotransferase family protein [Mucilaginibacter rivuli]MBW4890899.1 PLP-dependent aminotransferase family protein [Mucilaginibacter rivuli]
MEQSIDLQLNYPLISNQSDIFKNLLLSAIDKADSLLTVIPTGGRLKDKEIAGQWLSQAGFTVDPVDVYIGSGGHHSIIVALLAAKLQNKAVVVEELTYSNFKSIAKLFNIKLIACNIDERGIIPSHLAEICTLQKPDALFVAPTVNNPMGYVMPVDRRKEIVNIARAHNLIIIEDDAYGFLEEAILPNFFHLAPERSFYIYSFSKPLSQSIKASYLLAPKPFSKGVIDALRSTTSNNSPMLMEVLNDYITSGELIKLIDEKRREGFKRQQKVRELLAGYQVTGHKNGWHLWLNLPDGMSSAGFNQQLIAAGVKIVPSVAYSSIDGLHQQAIRIAFGGESDFDKVVEGIEIIKNLLA